MLAEEQAGFTPGWSSAEQIFNSRVITEKHLQHQRNFIDFKMAFGKVWLAGWLQVLRNFKVEEELVQLKAIQALYMRTPAVQSS